MVGHGRKCGGNEEVKPEAGGHGNIGPVGPITLKVKLIGGENWKGVRTGSGLVYYNLGKAEGLGNKGEPSLERKGTPGPKFRLGSRSQSQTLGRSNCKLNE